MKVTEKTEELLNHVIKNFVEKKGYKDIKSRLGDDYPDTAKIMRPNSEDFLEPDITATKNDFKNYFEIAIKTGETDRLVSKWMILSQLASRKGGYLHVIAPKGHYRFCEDLITKGNINVKLIKL